MIGNNTRSISTNYCACATAATASLDTKSTSKLFILVLCLSTGNVMSECYVYQCLKSDVHYSHLMIVHVHCVLYSFLKCIAGHEGKQMCSHYWWIACDVVQMHKHHIIVSRLELIACKIRISMIIAFAAHMVVSREYKYFKL